MCSSDLIALPDAEFDEGERVSDHDVDRDTQRVEAAGAPMLLDVDTMRIELQSIRRLLDA